MDRGVGSEDMLFGVLERRAESRVKNNFPWEFYFMAKAVLPASLNAQGKSGASRRKSYVLESRFSWESVGTILVSKLQQNYLLKFQKLSNFQKKIFKLSNFQTLGLFGWAPSVAGNDSACRAKDGSLEVSTMSYAYR